MTRFRKKPVEIDAWPIRSFVHGEPGRRALAFMPEPVQDAVERNCIAWDEDAGKLVIATLEGRMHGDLDDWLIRGIKGEFYACKPDVFEATYGPADSRSRFARSARVDGTTLFFDGVPFPFYVAEEGPSVEQLGPGFYVVTLPVFVDGEVTGITRETRPASVEELLDLTRQRLDIAERQHTALVKAREEGTR